MNRVYEISNADEKWTGTRETAEPTKKNEIAGWGKRVHEIRGNVSNDDGFFS